MKNTKHFAKYVQTKNKAHFWSHCVKYMHVFVKHRHPFWAWGKNVKTQQLSIQRENTEEKIP